MKMITREQLLAECCVPEAGLDGMDKARPYPIPERLADLELFLDAEAECALAEALELTNNPAAELTFIGVADWREAYLAMIRRQLRQLYEIRFWFRALGRALSPTPSQSRH